MVQVQPQRREEFTEVYEKYFDSVYRIAFLHIKNPEEAADICQNVFTKYLVCQKEFESEEHRKAWLLACAHTGVADYYRKKWRGHADLDELRDAPDAPFEIDGTLQLLLALPEKYKTPLYLYYYEGYKTDEIARMLHRPGSTIRVNLKRGRELLREKLGKEGETNE